MFEALVLKAAQAALPTLWQAAKHRAVPAISSRTKQSSGTPWLMVAAGVGLTYLMVTTVRSQD